MAENPPEGFDPHITSYYERRPEEDRLSTGIGQLEAHRTRELVGRFAPPPPGVLLDVGGAAGAYAFGFARAGYEVHLLDPVPRLVGLARSANESATAPLRSVQVGDARRLPFEDGSADLVLMLGPLYHLQDAKDRSAALGEAVRVLRPGGVLFAACITRWASLLDGVVYGYLDDPTFADLVDQDLATGRHVNPNETPGHFTTAFFHHPDEFVAELENPGMELLGVFGLEGPARMLADFEARWADPQRREHILRMVVALESEAAVIGVSPHLLGVCRKRDSDRD